MEERKAALDQFLLKISTPKEKAKRRVKKKFVFNMINLVKITAPDGLKIFEINEEYTNGNYIHTSSILKRRDSGGSILYFESQGRTIKASWIDNHTLEIIHDSNLQFTLKRNEDYYRGDVVKVIYKAIGDTPIPTPLLVY